eukprot:TRINITY_DN282_c0_g3_i1.p1 TRINITY_DN282_c0_g3~~TRINITY_DN282_c0_g3_i1.p1  ORF type:complete len:108 (+),score=8.31 TRINITY_DN282_c0_g3_i1:443-766(+)
MECELSIKMNHRPSNSIFWQRDWKSLEDVILQFLFALINYQQKNFSCIGKKIFAFRDHPSQCRRYIQKCSQKILTLAISNKSKEPLNHKRNETSTLQLQEKSSVPMK